MKVYLMAVSMMVIILVGCEKKETKFSTSRRSSPTKTSEHGGCDFSETDYCIDYTGTGFKKEEAALKADCASSGGIYVSNGCTSEGQLHNCTVDKGLNSEAVAHTYPDKNGLTADNWKEICSEMSSVR